MLHPYVVMEVNSQLQCDLHNILYRHTILAFHRVDQEYATPFSWEVVKTRSNVHIKSNSSY